MPLRLELANRPFGRTAVGQRSHSHPVTQRPPRAARHYVEGPARCLHLAHQALRVGLARKASELHRPGDAAGPERPSDGSARGRFGGRWGCFKRRRSSALCALSVATVGRRGTAGTASPGRRGAPRRRRGAAVGCGRPAGGRCSGPAPSMPPRGAAGEPIGSAAGGRPCWWPGRPDTCVSVVGEPRGERRQRRTFRAGQSSGTMSTISATNIVAPTRRSLRRRSIMGVCCIHGIAAYSIFGEASRPAGSRAAPANPGRRRPCETSRKRRSYRLREPPRVRGTGVGDSPAPWTGVLRCGAISATSAASPVPRAPSVVAIHHSSTRQRAPSPRPRILVREDPAHGERAARMGRASRLIASTRAASGL